MNIIRQLILILIQVAIQQSVSAFSLVPDATKARRIQVIAHRGASGYLPEHTLESKALAFMMQSDYLEQDLTLTRDNVPIVLHDIYLDEVTDVASKFPSRGRYLADKNVTKFYAIDFDFEEIKTLRATERFTTGSQAAFYAGRFPIWKASFQLNSFEEELEFIDGLAKSMSSVNKLTLGEIDVPVISTPGVYVELKRPEFHKFSGKANFSKIVLRILQKFNYTTNHSVFRPCRAWTREIRARLERTARPALVAGEWRRPGRFASS